MKASNQTDFNLMYIMAVKTVKIAPSYVHNDEYNDDEETATRTTEKVDLLPNSNLSTASIYQCKR